MRHLLPACLAVTLVLAACGFSPLYGSGAGRSGMAAVAGMDRVEIASIPDQSGMYLRNILIDQFYRDGYPASPAYILSVSKILEYRDDLDVTIDSEATRKRLKLTTTMVLIDKAANVELFKRDLIAIGTYNVLGSQFTTRVSEADAREAALGDLARQIEAQVALYFKR